MMRMRPLGNIFSSPAKRISCPDGYVAVPTGSTPSGNPCSSGQSLQPSDIRNCYKCGPTPGIRTVTPSSTPDSGAELSHSPYTNVTHDGSSANQGACPPGWFVMDPYNANPCAPGQTPQVASPDGVTQCGRCQITAAPFACPSGWTDQQIPCNPGEQPLELMHRNADGSVAACYQCRQTPESLAYQQKLAQATYQNAPAPTPPPVAPTQTATTSASFSSGWSTGMKLAVVGGALLVAGVIIKGMSKGGGGRSRRSSDDDEE